MRKEFRRFDIVVGAVFIILVIIGVVTISNSSKPAANSSHVTRATTAAGPASAPAVVHPGTLSPPATPSMPPPSPLARRLGTRPAAPPTGAPVAPAPDKAVRARTAPARPPATQPAPPPPPPTAAQAAPAAPAGCTPKTDAGNCYEPGEFCRDSDHGVSGVAGDGKAIRCEDNDGWRWEPV